MKAWITFCAIVFVLAFVLGYYVGRYCECDHAYWTGWNWCGETVVGK